jgi:hypothetical protein
VGCAGAHGRAALGRLNLGVFAAAKRFDVVNLPAAGISGDNGNRVRTSNRQVCEKWTLTFLQIRESLGYKSLIPFKISLFFRIFSLIICVGNCSRSGWR